MINMKLPYPWFGGKSKVAPLVWERMGHVDNCVEPFFGGGAWTITCPLDPLPTRTVNDIDGMVSNFWRAVQSEPDEVARWCDWPVDEARMHAVHLWLISRAEFRERIKTDMEFYDVKIAGLWVWGLCAWIGSGWCDSVYHVTEDVYSQQLSHLGNPGKGVNRPSQKRSHLGNPGTGVNRPSQKLSDDDATLPECAPQFGSKPDLYPYFQEIARIMRGVRVCCGDWQRVCGPTPTVKNGITAVFLDPPYSAEADRDDTLYSYEDLSVARDVREWALQWGGDERMRIALCGYTGEHDDPMLEAGWTPYFWKAAGGYGSQADGGRGRDNASREVIWFSPHCQPESQLLLFPAISVTSGCMGGNFDS